MIRSAVRGLVLACAVCATLRAASSAGAPVVLGVEQAWHNEYRELTNQMARFKKASPAWRARLQVEALDQQALIQATDISLVDVVLRRTSAFPAMRMASR